jgi:hypothetical protein
MIAVPAFRLVYLLTVRIVAWGAVGLRRVWDMPAVGLTVSPATVWLRTPSRRLQARLTSSGPRHARDGQAETDAHWWAHRESSY